MFKGLALSVFLFFLVPAVLPASECQRYYLEPTPGEQAMEYIMVLNKCQPSVQMGLRFECDDVYADKPVLGLYTERSRSRLDDEKENIQLMMGEISDSWFRLTGTYNMNVYDDDGMVVYYLDEDGVFKIVGEFI